MQQLVFIVYLSTMHGSLAVLPEFTIYKEMWHDFDLERDIDMFNDLTVHCFKTGSDIQISTGLIPIVLFVKAQIFKGYFPPPLNWIFLPCLKVE